MEKQIDKILKKNWDVLIVLDACRYDIFNDIYPGDVDKVYSAGSQTHHFCVNVFEKYSEEFDDINVISANPHLNSYKLPNREFDPEDKFKKIYDVWKKTDKNNITRPEYVLDKFDEVKEEGEKYILWFMQPHFPYLNYPCCMEAEIDYNGIQIDPSIFREIVVKIEGILPFSLARLLWKFWDKTIGFSGSMRKTMCAHGRDAPYKGYVYSLKYTLAKIMSYDFGDRDVIITGDHGEILTWENRKKYGAFSHPQNKEYPVLREVPWTRLDFG